MQVLVVAGNKNVSYPLYNLTSCTTDALSSELNYLCSELNPTTKCLRTPADQDIRTIVNAIFGEINELTVMETLDLNNTCGNDTPTHVKYFGRSARLIFNSSVTSECVL